MSGKVMLKNVLMLWEHMWRHLMYVYIPLTGLFLHVGDWHYFYAEQIKSLPPKQRARVAIAQKLPN